MKKLNLFVIMATFTVLLPLSFVQSASPSDVRAIYQAKAEQDKVAAARQASKAAKKARKAEKKNAKAIQAAPVESEDKDSSCCEDEKKCCPFGRFFCGMACCMIKAPFQLLFCTVNGLRYLCCPPCGSEDKEANNQIFRISDVLQEDDGKIALIKADFHCPDCWQRYSFELIKDSAETQTFHCEMPSCKSNMIFYPIRSLIQGTLKEEREKTSVVEKNKKLPRFSLDHECVCCNQEISRNNTVILMNVSFDQEALKAGKFRSEGGIWQADDLSMPTLLAQKLTQDFSPTIFAFANDRAFENARSLGFELKNCACHTFRLYHDACLKTMKEQAKAHGADYLMCKMCRNPLRGQAFEVSLGNLTVDKRNLDQYCIRFSGIAKLTMLGLHEHNYKSMPSAIRHGKLNKSVPQYQVSQRERPKMRSSEDQRFIEDDVDVSSEEKELVVVKKVSPQDQQASPQIVVNNYYFGSGMPFDQSLKEDLVVRISVADLPELIDEICTDLGAERAVVFAGLRECASAIQDDLFVFSDSRLNAAQFSFLMEFARKKTASAPALVRFSIDEFIGLVQSAEKNLEFNELQELTAILENGREAGYVELSQPTVEYLRERAQFVHNEMQDDDQA